jgi:hypothetical protein
MAEMQTARRIRRVLVGGAVLGVALTGVGASAARATGDEDPAHFCYHVSAGIASYDVYDDGGLTELTHHYLEPTLPGVHEANCRILVNLDGAVGLLNDPETQANFLDIVIYNESSYLNQVLKLCIIPYCDPTP